MQPLFNITRRKVGGIWFIRLGRVTISISVSRTYRPLAQARRKATPRAQLLLTHFNKA